MPRPPEAAEGKAVPSRLSPAAQQGGCTGGASRGRGRSAPAPPAVLPVSAHFFFNGTRPDLLRPERAAGLSPAVLSQASRSSAVPGAVSDPFLSVNFWVRGPAYL